MNGELRRYAHNPPHLFADKQMYFITGSTLYHRPYLEKDGAKKALLEITADFLTRKEWRLDHWVILDDHYHLTAESQSGDDLSLIMGNIHRKSAKAIRQQTDLRVVKKVWHNYWDRCVRDEREFTIV